MAGSSDESSSEEEDSGSAFSEGGQEESSSDALSSGADEESSDVDASEPSGSIANSADLSEEEDKQRKFGQKISTAERKEGTDTYQYGKSRGGGGGRAKRNTGFRPITGSTVPTQKVEDEDEGDGGEGGEGEEVPADGKSWAWHNMNSVVEQNKDGPWYTQPDYIMDEKEQRPDHPDYDPSTIHIPEPEW